MRLETEVTDVWGATYLYTHTELYCSDCHLVR